MINEWESKVLSGIYLLKDPISHDSGFHSHLLILIHSMDKNGSDLEKHGDYNQMGILVYSYFILRFNICTC